MVGFSLCGILFDVRLCFDMVSQDDLYVVLPSA